MVPTILRIVVSGRILVPVTDIPTARGTLGAAVRVIWFVRTLGPVRQGRP